MTTFYAHSIEGKPKSEWQGRQLLEPIKQLERFVRFERLRNAGLWHDLELKKKVYKNKISEYVLKN